MKKIFERVSAFFAKYLFNSKWRCVACNREIFDKGYFCEKCKNELPLQNGCICQHCGRKLKRAQDYCTTCKGRLTSVDMARSVYSYLMPISALIKRLKYKNGRYLVDVFATEMVNLYYKNYFNADGIVYVPMTKMANKKRGYNQSELLARAISERTGIPLLDCVEKLKDTDRQATLNRQNRLVNLKDAFKIKNKSQVKDKTIVIIDDVTTTGATAEVIAQALKKASAARVYLLSVASVPPRDGY